MRPWKGQRGPSTPLPPPQVKRVPNPVKSLRLLSRKDVAVSIMPGGFLYTVYCCIHTSLSTTFIQVYHLDEWQAGLIYLPFGIGAIAATLISSKRIDRDYRIVATAHGLPVIKVSGDDLLNFPIEEARLRGAFTPTLCAFLSVLIYGWLVNQQVVSTQCRQILCLLADETKHIAGPLTCLFFTGLSIQTCFNVILFRGDIGSITSADKFRSITLCWSISIKISQLQRKLHLTSFDAYFPPSWLLFFKRS